jgi:hypothetical protein
MIPQAADVRPPLTIERVASAVGRRVRTLASGLGSLPPKLIYGNSAGLRQNFGARRELRRLRERFTDDGHILDAPPYVQQAAALSDRGYLQVPSTADTAVLAAVRSRVVECMESSASSVASGNGATRFVVDPLREIPQLRALLTEELSRVIAQYYRCALRVESVRIWRNYHVPGIDADTDDRYSNTFHHDNCPVSGLRVFVLLNDGVTRQTGALRFHDKATSRRLMRSLGYFHRNAMPSWMRRRLVDAQSLRYFEGNLGDTCICNTQECLHAASVPRLGAYRDMLQFEVYPAAGPYAHPEQLLDKVPPDREILAFVHR